jgi:hypothetical protein
MGAARAVRAAKACMVGFEAPCRKGGISKGERTGKLHLCDRFKGPLEGDRREQWPEWVALLRFTLLVDRYSTPGNWCMMMWLYRHMCQLWAHATIGSRIGLLLLTASSILSHHRVFKVFR